MLGMPALFDDVAELEARGDLTLRCVVPAEQYVRGAANWQGDESPSTLLALAWNGVVLVVGFGFLVGIFFKEDAKLAEAKGPPGTGQAVVSDGSADLPGHHGRRQDGEFLDVCRPG